MRHLNLGNPGSQYHHAIHPDMFVLSASVSENDTEMFFKGDTKESIEQLKLSCLVQTHVFCQNVLQYYGDVVNEIAGELLSQLNAAYDD